MSPGLGVPGWLAADTTRVRHRNGLIPMLDVLEAQKAALQARDALIQADAASARDLVALYKALGGGWSSAALPAGAELR